MFDPITSALIAASPPLDGLDLEALPKRLTEAFADIVAARIRLRGEQGEEASETLRDTLLEVRRLAAAHEAFVALLPERENRAAAAFVAASAHQVCLAASKSGDDGFSYLDGATVAPEICATLLFMVAEAHADAAECSKRISADPDNATVVEQALATSIKFLATGRLANIGQLELPDIDTGRTAPEKAIDALFLELLRGIKKLAARLLLPVDAETAASRGIEPASAHFARVKALSVGQLEDVFAAGDHIFNLFPGPLHLANLLIAVERDLVESALARVSPPHGVDGDGWWQIIRRMARRRPFLWRNHRDAIASDYLEKGKSSAISFPTGGGKSTLAELKIAASLIRGEKVVFLVPTHALVDQTTRALKDTFNTFEIVGDVEDDVTLSEIVILPEVIVTTPERCLMLLTTQPEAFADLGLIVFDECHLLHPRDSDRSRRSIDSMLAILNLTIAAPEADLLLLSAMMKNADEIAKWVEELTGRACLSLSLAWKPTRQVRGSVVYQADAIKDLKAKLQQARRDYPDHKNTPVAVKRELVAQPFGFFSLLQTWATKDRDDYTLQPLLDDAHHLSTGRSKGGAWYLTPNGNHTSALIAAAAASSALKTLVFVQSTVLADSSVKEFPELVDARKVKLTDDELELHRLAAEEMGGADHCYLTPTAKGNYRGGAASHHALLLREERLLHESLFKRKDGIDVLFATSTLAQGMNLPSEVVIISGDSRFDPEADKMAQLEAHELLNAAGRAGRAGESSQGFVLVVPSRVVEFDNQSNLINAHWLTLQSIFAQSDQCLIIDDPTTALLDRIHAGTFDHGMPAYFLSRLPASDENGTDTPIRSLLSRSFAAFRARQKGDADWVESRIAAAFAARKKAEPEDDAKWLDRVSGLTGVPVAILNDLNDLFAKPENAATIEAAIAALVDWLKANPAWLLELVRPENVEGLFGTPYKNLTSNHDRGNYALPVIAAMLASWMNGAPLNVMETNYPKGGDKNRCEYSRHFVLRIVPDMAFVAGLPARLFAAQNEEDTPIPITLATFGSCVREGCSSPESLAVRLSMGRSVSRVAARARYDELLPYFEPGDPEEAFDQTIERYRGASTSMLLREL
ncbi:DEAD/DEAH box helicase [Erythrobacter sp. A6_0]|uniref:DEAD/DEAH box helicase n=1 Tax=Erythrobacter sp. A6_0 TaxID=2821089 RepID=UPI001AD9C98E|nr:DEAD/DEAH box helicase [Erythrobacter sp. A6_0]MBO9510877.1 DEAD/DEAH box helicase [Erythrobacter sp. A6_0]